MSATGVVVVTYGSPHLLDEHLAAIAWAEGTVVVVVDNLASAGDRAAVADRCTAHGWEFVPMPGNLGFGIACNRGAEVAFARGCDVVLLLNPDASGRPEVLEALAEQCRTDPMAMAAPVLERGNGRPAASWRTLDLVRGRNTRRAGFDGTAEGDWLGAACLAVGRPLWEAMGGFDEGYFLYWEDVDLSRRAHEVGGRLIPRPDLVARHDVGATQTTGTRAKTPLYVYWNCRNRLRYAALHQTRREILTWLLHTPRESVRIAQRGGRRALLTRPSLQWATIRGTVAGLVAVVRESR